MNRNEFMRQLEYLLSDVTPNERNEALQFYNDYFEDAGAENEQEVIKALGSPAKVAATIKADLTGNATGAFTETGYQDFYSKNQEVVAYGQNAKGQTAYGQSANNGQNTNADGNKQGSGYQNSAYQNGTYQNNANNQYQNNPYQNNAYQNGANATNSGKKKMSGGMLALIIILCIFASPFLIGIAAVVFGVVITLIAALFSVFIGLAASAFALILVGVVLLVVGIIKMFAMPFGGMCLAGTGLVCAGFGILFVILTVWIAIIAVPAVFKGIVWLWHKIFPKKRGAAV